MEWAEIYRRLEHDRNDSLAWDALERRVRPWARRRLWERGWDVVEDVVADTCAAVVLAVDKARGADTFAGFAYGHFLNAVKRPLAEPRLERIDPGGAGPDLSAEPPDETPDDDEIAILRHCLGELPDRERQAVEARWLREESGTAIATALNVTAVNARRILFNGMAHLRRCIERMVAQLGSGSTIRGEKHGRG